MLRSTTNPWLARFAIFTAAMTLCLICLGGLVTSYGVGMAVPDWPNTYGYNMFLFPVSKWVGGIFYEHTHRLLAATVGFLTVILAVWLWLKEERRWLRWMGVASVILVILQGVVGGLRVVLSKQELGIVHALLAQLFLISVASIALFLTPFWSRLKERRGIALNPWLKTALFFTTFLIFSQLLLGASMRHQHAGLAVPDFPLAYGKLWPPTDAAFIEKANRLRLDARDFDPITAFQIELHMAHRVGAMVILLAVAICFGLARGKVSDALLRRGTGLWLGLILVQAGLGAWTVWSNKAADVATAHVVTGALSFLTGAFLCSITARIEAKNSHARNEARNVNSFDLKHSEKGVGVLA